MRLFFNKLKVVRSLLITAEAVLVPNNKKPCIRSADVRASATGCNVSTLGGTAPSVPAGWGDRARTSADPGDAGGALGIAAGTPGGASQADVWRAALESEVPRVTRAACSRGCDEPLERCMEARAQQVERPLRRVGVQTPPRSGVCLTHGPPRIVPRQVADLSRVGWEVERRIQLDTSVHRLDQMDAERPCARTTLADASRLASPLAAVLAHQHDSNTRAREAGAPRTEAPLPRAAWPCHWRCPVRASPRPSSCREQPPRGDGTRSPRGSRRREPTPTGAVARPCGISDGVGSASPWLGRKTATMAYRWWLT